MVCKLAAVASQGSGVAPGGDRSVVNRVTVKLRIGAASAAIVFASAMPACAQEAAASQPDPEAIVVTGSRLKQQESASPVPVARFDAAELRDNGKVSLGDTLNNLPQLRTSFSQAENTGAPGVAGLNLLDLRGLGVQRTLVLVNGRRHVGSDSIISGRAVDVGTMPTDLIKRVDIVTGGSSAVYGSDAIAGVVNFLLDDSFQGVRGGGQAGISSRGDAGQQRLTLTAGTNFADGRGNVTIAGEYSNQDPLFASQRDYLRSVTQFVQTDSDLTGGSDGIPDRTLFSDVRSTTLAPGGLFTAGSRQCGQDTAGAFYDCTFLFQPDGSLVAQTGTRVGLVEGADKFVGGNGATNREGETLQLLSKTQRWGGNLLAHYEFSPAATAFLEAKYYHVRSTSSFGPAFFQGSTLSTAFGGTTVAGTARERPRLDNGFLTDQARALILAQLQAQATANGTPQPTASSRFNLKINLTEFGLRQEDSTRDTFRVVGGLRGDLSPHLRYEVSANYGQFDETTVLRNNVNVQRLLLALDAVKVGDSVVCRSQISSAAAVPLQRNDAALAALGADVAACVPVNLFGTGNVTDAARRYIVQDTVSRGRISQFDATAFVSGDTGAFFNLPGGPLSFVAGAEFRRDTLRFSQDPTVASGLTFYNPIGAVNAPAQEAREIFGELRLPILSGVPFAHDLSLSADGRLSDYNFSAGTTRAWNVMAQYAPIPSLRFRAGYARAVRAPNIYELNAGDSRTYTILIDPCGAPFTGAGTQYRAANCAADGIPDTFGYFTDLPFPPAAAPFVVRGNPNLKPEYSNSWTFGATLEPGGAMRGLSIRFDYYNIGVNNVIGTLPPQMVVNLCYDSPSLNNGFCSLFRRNRTDVAGPNGEVPLQILDSSVIVSGQNFARLRNRGFDVDVSYARTFDFGRVSSHLTWNHQIENMTFFDFQNPDFGNSLRKEAGDPVDSFNWNVGLERGRLSVNYGVRYIGPMTVAGNEIENVDSVQGRALQDADWSSPAFTPATWYHSAKVGLNIDDRFQWYLGCDNLFDTLPPNGQTGVGPNGPSVTNGAAANRIFDVYGRYLYTGFSARF